MAIDRVEAILMRRCYYLKCPYCGCDARLADSKIIYGRSYGLVFICLNYPRCDAYVGVRSGKPMGTMANAELREYRKLAHATFDRLWKSGAMTRSGAYRLLAERLGLQPVDAHIGLFDVNMCRKTIEVAMGLPGERRSAIVSSYGLEGGRI